MKLKMVRIEYANRILVAKNFHIDNLILHYSEKLLFMHDNMHGLGWLNGQQRGTKTECVVCICNMCIYMCIYIYIFLEKDRSRNVENDCFFIFWLSYIYCIHKDKTMTIFTQSILINCSSIKTRHYPIFQTLIIFLTGKYIFFTETFLGLNNLLESMISSFLLVSSPLPHLQLYSTM